MGNGKRKNASTPWRQDFRDVQTLPDLKIVRTHFLLNLIVGMLALILAGLAIYQQYGLTAKRMNLVEMEKSIREFSTSDKRNQETCAKFMRDARKVAEATTFAFVEVPPERFVVELAKLRPIQGQYEYLSYERIEKKDAVDAIAKGIINAGGFDKLKDKTSLKDCKTAYTFTLSGTMVDEATRSASFLIDDFIAKLGYASSLANTGRLVDLAGSSPDKAMNRFTFAVKLEWIPIPTEVSK